MKHNIIYMLGLGIAFMLSLGSCSDFLEKEPQDRITLEKFWNEKGDVEAIIAGTYNLIAAYDVTARMLVWGEFRSENVVDNQSTLEDLDLQKFMKENINASNNYTRWVALYTVINRCNTVIHYAPGIAAKDPSYRESEVNAHIAEVTALRSLMYFYLIRAFRNVPYTSTAYLEDSQKMDIPASSFDAVLDSCIQSLESVKGWALTSYPVDATGDAVNFNTGRVTRSMIYALLCEMYLWKKDYQQCINYADLLIEEKKKEAKEKYGYSETDFTDFNGYPLIASRRTVLGSPRYGYAFNQIFVFGNSMESIFEINYSKNGGTDQISNVAIGNIYGGSGHSPRVTYSTYIGNDSKDDNNKVFGKADIRAKENMYLSAAYISKFTLMSSFSQNGNTSIAKNLDYYGVQAQYPTTNNGNTSLNKSNFIIYRISDIMLLKAEALTQLMKDNQTTLDDVDKAYRDEAFGLVDAVNKRSMCYTTASVTTSPDVLNVADYDTKEKITDLVYKERHRELMFEGKRYFDLVRRSLREGNVEYLRENVLNKDVNLRSAINATMKDLNGIFLPYHIDELKVNTNLTQNPAFPSGENSSYTSTN